MKKYLSTNYSILGKKLDEEMNSLLKRKEEEKPKKRGLIYLDVLFPIFLLQKNFQERWYATKSSFGIF